ncbi:MAG: DMT family transporter [Planctomycetes bacterium]|nr:DMT family transporter [Planctomycetota bacterium]
MSEARFGPYGLYLLMALLAGVATAYQPGLNARFASHTPSRLYGALLNFVVGAFAMGLITLLARAPAPTSASLSAAPWWSYLGGTLGAFFVTTAVMLVPKMGNASYLAAMIAGQLMASVVIDHFGHMGLDQHPFTWGKAVGIALMLAGVLCIKFL